METKNIMIVGVGGQGTLLTSRILHPIDPADFLSQGKATPFTGWPVQARCLLTVCNGRLVWQDGDLFSKEDRT